MFSTFADVFGSDDKQMNGTTNPFGGTSTTINVDPFGISSDMKLSASSQRFDDSPFIVDSTTINDESNRLHTGKDALSSTNWNAYQNSSDEQNLDPLENLQTKSSSLSINNNNITHSKSINLINPFSIPAMSNETSTLPNQASAIDLLFDLNIDPSTLPTTNSDKSLTNSDQIQSSYDLLGLNKQTNPAPTVKVLKSDSLTDIPKASQTKKPSATSSLSAKSTIPTATSLHSMPTNLPPPASPSTLRVQATALSILTGTTSTTPFDDQFLDWMTQSDDLMCGVDPKISGPSKKMDINMLKSTEDLLGSIYRQPPPQTLKIVQETSQEIITSPTKPMPIRRPSIEEVPSIRIHEPTSDHDDNNIVPQGYFDNTKKVEKENDSDDSDDSKMVFKIHDKKADTSLNQAINIPVPLLPPPPSPSSSRKYKEASDDASSSSSETENEDDPLAMFRSKSVKNNTNQKQGNNLITDWDEPEDTVCLILVYVYLLLSCRQGSCCNIICKTFLNLYLFFVARERRSITTTTTSTSGLLFT